ncbi:NitT/TauT family transport system substrate-binding protein [Granulicatella balaenopterae]|uniref:NitT/TauT family transport system substrate-binding protein n=1 Tax=Granulicatella balaenopterae TaxID=137733 RepID=A0A1H9J2Y8_9LACT|nr:ABC transporter substrate-binding protein [Granulicatella balaenopterae]SEQ80975.1 NitT/TauT family transport system substrate-binding protein [Granulicatella balaenopterae]
MKKKFLLIITTLMTIFLVACSNQSTTTTEESDSSQATTEVIEPTIVKVGIPPAPPALPILKMIEDNALGDEVKLEYELWDQGEKLVAMVQQDDFDMFAFPLTFAAKLNNKGIDIKLMNVNTWGVGYVLTNDKDFTSWDQLRGKTLYVTIKGSPLDAYTQYFLKENGLEPGTDVTIQYASPIEIGSLLISGEAEYGVAIEPQATRALMQNSELVRAMSLNEEYQKVANTTEKIPTAGFGAKGSFIEENPELAVKIQDEYAKAITWINEHPEEAGSLAEKYLSLKQPLVTKAIPNMGLEFKSAKDAKSELENMYKILENVNPKLIGGQLPSDSLYYEQ